MSCQKTVNRVRQWLFRLGYNRGPRDPFVIAKLEGLVVVPQTLPDSIGGMLYKLPKHSYVYLNRHHHTTRQCYTLAHELVHFKFHPDVMPEQEVRRLRRCGVSFGAMAGYLGVSYEAMGRRLQELGF
jgi:Zn-dependent peptidase ImmA (M78 family)